jgi:DNA modification methylase
LHIARWAVQQFTEVGGRVLDPTMGAGTTAVEAITQGRSAAGVELQYGDTIQANVKKALELARAQGYDAQVKIAVGDAREIGSFLEPLGWTFDLIVNNPPYSGDESMPSPAKEGRGKQFRGKETAFRYDKELPNIAFLREGEEYWQTLLDVYRQSVSFLRPGGHFVTGVKDMVREKKIFPLHQMICDRVLGGVPDLEFVGTAVLRHYPPTLFMSSARQIHGYAFDPPKYQTISVFRKRG